MTELFEKLLRTFQSARRVGTPIMFVTTSDPSATMRRLMDASKAEVPAVAHDVSRGLYPLNDAGNAAIAEAQIDTPSMLTNPSEAYTQAMALPKYTIFFALNAHRYIDEPTVMQAVWNLRDQFKKNFRTFVGIVPDIVLPDELQHDALVLDEPLPREPELGEIFRKLYVKAQEAALKQGVTMPEITNELVDDVAAALIGLSAFEAEQTVAMSLSPNGVDVKEIWERKYRSIDQTQGLSVYRGTETFADIGGYDNAKKFLLGITKKKKPRVILFMDEGEKTFAASESDSSGVKQGINQKMLTWTQDSGAVGAIEFGVSGSGKSLISKALGNEIGCLTIVMDLLGMQGSKVGETEAALRNALRRVDAIRGSGEVLMLMTCNKMDTLSAELQRRFKFGVMFYDVPTSQGRAKIWPIHLKKYDISAAFAIPDDDNWVGADIERCCDLADRMECSLIEASKFFAPVFRSNFEAIARMRELASGRYIDAEKSGVYKKPKLVNDDLRPDTVRAIEMMTPDSVGSA